MELTEVGADRYSVLGSSPSTQFPSSFTSAADEFLPIETESENEKSEQRPSSVQIEQPTQAIEVQLLPGQILGEGMSAYVTFTVHTRTTLPQFKQAEFSKTRRYRDFLWLHAHLQERHRGILIPPIPEKSITEKFSPEFIEFRRRELEKFLKRVVAHPVLVTSQHLQIFLEAPDSAMQEAKVTHQTGGLLNSVTNFFGVKVMNSLAPAIEVDMWFDGKTRYIANLESSLLHLANSINSSIFKTCELYDIHTDTAAGMTMLSNCETESNRGLADSLSKLSEVFAQMTALDREYASATKISFEDCLRDYLRLIGSVKVMMSQRLERLAAYQDVISNSKAKKDRLEKIRREGGQVPVALNHEIERLETMLEREREAYETISKSCRGELERFEQAKAKEIQQAITMLVQSSLTFQLRAVDLWKSFLRNLPDNNPPQ